jgi:Holliday junction resolvasome RuvABC endonuclease subunit
MRILGIRPTKDKLMWALIEGTCREDAVSLRHATLSAPIGDRGQELVWVRQEIHELLDQWKPDRVAIRVADPGGKANSLPRAETDGVVQEAVAAKGVPFRRFHGATVRASFSAKTTIDFKAALSNIPLTASTPTSRIDPVAAAVAELPA